MTRSNKLFSAIILASLLLLACSPLRAQSPPPPAFLADHYDITAMLDPITQTLSAVAKVDFKARDVSSAVRVELQWSAQRLSREVVENRILLRERYSGVEA